MKNIYPAAKEDIISWEANCESDDMLGEQSVARGDSGVVLSYLSIPRSHGSRQRSRKTRDISENNSPAFIYT